jgi:RHS repeat-associated protein
LLDTTGLYYLRARQYDTTLGRFLQLDPVQRVRSQPASSTYSYAGNAPTFMIDPSGMTSVPATDATDAAGVASSTDGDRTESSTCVSPSELRTLSSRRLPSCRDARWKGKYGSLLSTRVNVSKNGRLWLNWGFTPGVANRGYITTLVPIFLVNEIPMEPPNLNFVPSFSDNVTYTYHGTIPRGGYTPFFEPWLKIPLKVGDIMTFEFRSAGPRGTYQFLPRSCRI